MTAVKKGDIRLLQNTFVRYESFFIGAGIYLLLEKLKFVAYRNLFKKMYVFINIGETTMFNPCLVVQLISLLSCEDSVSLVVIGVVTSHIYYYQ